MNKISEVPYLNALDFSDLEKLELRMESEASKILLSEVNWPAEFPYMPSVSVMIARSDTHIIVFFQVRGHDVRATVVKDNDMVCHDSCCEFFVGDPHDGTYYNFEMNCIGTVKAAKRRSRHEFQLFPSSDLEKIVRLTSLERKEMHLSGICSWQAAFCIPFELMGFNAHSIPERLSANFYKCADKSDHPHFLSWNPIRTESPDFHRPEFFGQLKMK